MLPVDLTWFRNSGIEYITELDAPLTDTGRQLSPSRLDPTNVQRVPGQHTGAYSRPGRASLHSLRVRLRPAMAHARRIQEDGRMSQR